MIPSSALPDERAELNAAVPPIAGDDHTIRRSLGLGQLEAGRLRAVAEEVLHKTFSPTPSPTDILILIFTSRSGVSFR